jgi:hypothetical protein
MHYPHHKGKQMSKLGNRLVSVLFSARVQYAHTTPYTRDNLAKKEQAV